MAHTPAAVAMCDTKMRYLAYSQRWAEDYGLKDQNLVGRCHYDLFPDLPWRNHSHAIISPTPIHELLVKGFCPAMERKIGVFVVE